MRLDKFLCDMGLGTRSQVKDRIRKGQVLVDGIVCRQPETKVSEGVEVTFEGRPVSYTAMEYYMLYKPAGVVSAVEDLREQTVVELIGERKRKDLFPVGRLDKDTEGLLLITNDGQLSHRLLSPKRHVEKVYYARVDGPVQEAYVEKFKEGLDIGDEKPTLPAKLEILMSGEDASEIRLTICEGRYHQVKRMMEAAGCHVTYLKRLSMGPLKLDEALKPGEYRHLTKAEIQKLKEL